jgi:hypothetical protein
MRNRTQMKQTRICVRSRRKTPTLVYDQRFDFVIFKTKLV